MHLIVKDEKAISSEGELGKDQNSREAVNQSTMVEDYKNGAMGSETQRLRLIDEKKKIEKSQDNAYFRMGYQNGDRKAFEGLGMSNDLR